MRTPSDEEFNKMIEFGEDFLSEVVKEEEYEIAKDLTGLIDALKTKDPEKVIEEINKYQIESVEYKGFNLRFIEYDNVWSGHLLMFDEILKISESETKDECVDFAKKKIDIITSLFGF